MSSTRHAKPGSGFRQEKYSSGFKGGLLANLVAKRCRQLEPADRQAVWFLQMISWQSDLAILGKQFGIDTDYIARLCLSPEEPSPEMHWLLPRVEEARTDWLSALPHTVETAITRKVAEALDYAMQSRALTVVDGHARIGKSFAAVEWCRRSAGLARYVQVPCSNDDISFFRAIGQALGVSSSLQLKAAEIRARVEETLDEGDLTLVFDEGHYLWPQNWQRYAMPARVNWIMTALVNRNVPVAIITTPQFYSAQKRLERLTGWNSEQFLGRIGHLERLPERLEKSDLYAVARVMLPECDTETWKALASFAAGSATHLGCLDAISRRARWFASQEGRQGALAGDVRRVMKERIGTFDNPIGARAESAGAAGSANRPRDIGEDAAQIMPQPRFAVS